MNKFTAALEKSQIDIVPKTVVNMGGAGNNSTVNAFEMLMGLLINEKLGNPLQTDDETEDSAKIKAIKDSILNSIEENSNKVSAKMAEKAETNRQ